MKGFDDDALSLLQFILGVGERYWGFERQIIFGVINYFSLKEADTVPFVPHNFGKFLMKMLEIEEYRGKDSAIVLHQHSSHKVYTKQLLHPNADYDGTALRLSTIHWAA